MSGLPKWEPRNDREVRALKHWTIARLVENSPELVSLYTDDAWMSLSHWGLFQPPIRSVVSLWFAELAAQHDNMQPMHSLVEERIGVDPEPYLRPRARRPGEYDRHARPWALQQAVADVARIRAIWKAHFSRWKRGDGLAEEIAAERWGLDEEELRRALN